MPAEGVEDFLVKDEVSGALLLQAIRTALNANRRWRERKTAAYKTTQRFHWADDKCQAIYALGSRLIRLGRTDSALACGKAVVAIANDYGDAVGSSLDGRVDLLLTLERLAHAAAASHKDLARHFRSLIAPPHNADAAMRLMFKDAVRRRSAQLDLNRQVPEMAEKSDLAVLLRQILTDVPDIE